MNRAVEEKFIPSRYMRRASKIVVQALHEKHTVPWDEVKELESLRGTESCVPADFVLARTIPRLIKLPRKPIEASESMITQEHRYQTDNVSFELKNID